MYESYYDLKKNPFSSTPDPQYLYLGTTHREALAHLLYGVKERKGFIVLTGEVGTGKTTLVHHLLDKLNVRNDTRTAFLFNPKLSVEDFIHYILSDLGVDVDGATKGNALRLLQQSLLSTYQDGGQVILFVDEAQALEPALLEEIRLLSNLETTKSKLLQIVLIGQPELDRTLNQSNFRQLRQRINLRYHLRPLSENETKEYIEKRLRIAGAKGPIFTRRAMSEVYNFSRGIPRLINILCDNSLLSGYASDQKVVDIRCIQEAARDLKLKPPHIRNMSRFLLRIISGINPFSFVTRSAKNV